MVRSDDSAKLDFTLVDLDMIERFARHLTAAVPSKGRDNWRRASTEEDVQRFRASAWRHFVAWQRGEIDEDQLRKVIGLSAPKPGAKVLKKPEQGGGPGEAPPGGGGAPPDSVAGPLSRETRRGALPPHYPALKGPLPMPVKELEIIEESRFEPALKGRVRLVSFTLDSPEPGVPALEVAVTSAMGAINIATKKDSGPSAVKGLRCIELHVATTRICPSWDVIQSMKSPAMPRWTPESPTALRPEAPANIFSISSTNRTPLPIASRMARVSRMACSLAPTTPFLMAVQRSL